MSNLPLPPPPPPVPPPPPPPFVPASLPSPSPVPTPRAPLSRAAILAWALGGLAVVLLAVGLGWWNYEHSKPANRLLLAELNRRVGTTAHYDKIQVSVSPGPGPSVRIDFTAQGRLTESLYAAEDTRNHLANELHYQTAETEAAARILRSRDRDRLIEWARLGPPPADPLGAVLLREVAAHGAPVTTTGVAQAARAGQEWKLGFGALATEPASLAEGRPRGAFGQPAFVLTQPADAAKLKALVEENQAYGRRVVAAANDFAQKLAEEKAARLDRLLSGLQAGAIYSGVGSNAQESHPVYLEFTGARKGPATVTALLRNDGGWLDTRGFAGVWRTDEDGSRLTLDLSTQNNQSVPNGGQFLDSYAWSMSLELDDTGHLAGRTNGGWQITFDRVPEAEVAKLRAQVNGEFTDLLALTAPGSVLLGSGVNRNNGASEALLLYFTSQDPKAGIIHGRFQSPERGNLRREFSGVLVANRYRANGHPLRISLRSADHSRLAPNDTLLGNSWDRDLPLKDEAGELTGELQGIDYRFARATPDQLAELERRNRDKESQFAAVFRTGAVYSGTVRHTGGYVSRVRLHIQQVDPLEHTVTYSLDSLEYPGVFRQFSGSYDVVGLTVDAVSTQKLRVSNNAHLEVPFFKYSYNFSLRLTRNETEISGESHELGTSGWTLSFPLQAPAAARTPEAPGTGAAGPSIYPEAEGAYVLRDGAWVALPRNNGKVTYGTQQVVNNVLGVLNALSGGKNTAKVAEMSDKLADLTFDGTAPIPMVPPQNVTVLFVGKPVPATPDVIAKNPELADYPGMEMTSTQTDAGGRRQADLLRIAAGHAGFREKRVSASMDDIDDRHYLLTATAPLPAGTYALGVSGGQYFELKVGY